MKRTKIIPIRFTAEEHLKILNKANQLGLNVSEFIRMICLKIKLDIVLEDV